MFILGFPVPVYTPCAYRDLSYWQRSGVNTERPPEDVPCSCQTVQHEFHAVFIHCSCSVHPEDFTPRPFKLTVVWGEHATSSGGRAMFLGQFERGMTYLQYLPGQSLPQVAFQLQQPFYKTCGEKATVNNHTNEVRIL